MVQEFISDDWQGPSTICILNVFFIDIACRNCQTQVRLKEHSDHFLHYLSFGFAIFKYMTK